MKVWQGLLIETFLVVILLVIALHTTGTISLVLIANAGFVFGHLIFHTASWIKDSWKFDDFDW